MPKPKTVTVAARLPRSTVADLRRFARTLPRVGRVPTVSDALRVLVAQALAAHATRDTEAA